jgi:hypothetical protein
MKPRPTLSRNLAGLLFCLLTFVASSFSAQIAQPLHSGLTGTVQDPTGAIISGANVQLTLADGKPVSSATTDSTGKFQLAQPAPGNYTLTITLSGFSSLVRALHVTTAALPPFAITMNLASVATDVTVNADQDLAITDPDANADSASVTADDMKSLPIFDADIVATLSAFLDVGAAGEGGTSLIIDGVESKTVGVSPSAIERVNVNQDPYSAQYRNPGRGQVEIITKSAADHFHGEFSFTYRNAALNAENYFATSNPASQRRIYEGFLTGPVLGFSKKPIPHTAFLFSLTRREAYNLAQIDATQLPVPTLAVNVPAPQLSTNLTFKVSHDYNDHHSAYLLYRFNRGSMINQNIGGQVLQSAGFNVFNYDMDVTYHDDLTLSANKLNQFNILFERNLDRYANNVNATQYIVNGVATFHGGAENEYYTENNPNLSDIFSWTLPTHIPQQLKFGIQLPNQGRRIIEDETNRYGTYTFANFAAYQAGTPSSFSIQTGPTRFQTVYSQPGAFFLDQIQLTPNLTVVPGVRYDYQDAIPGTKDAIEPHLSVAYVLDKTSGLVVRTGGAIYMRRVGVNIGQQIARYSRPNELSLLNTSNPCFPISAACNPAAGQVPSLFNYAPNIKAPMQGYFGLSVERNITKQSTITLGYNGYRGWHTLRSIDVNAPLPPFTSSVRPNPNYSQSLQLNSGGYQKTDGLSLNFRGRITSAFSGNLQYTWQHADANTQWSTFSPQNQYRPNDEWARTDFDQRQRLSVFGTIYPDKPFTLGVGYYAYTALPYTITTGTDDYHTGLFNARPAGVARNSLNGGGNQDLQVRLGYTHKLRAFQRVAVVPAGAPPAEATPQTISFSISSFNTLNHPNFEDYIGVITSPAFMHPTTAAPPRRLQLSASYTF